MERLQAKGEIPQEELAALESDMTGKVIRSQICHNSLSVLTLNSYLKIMLASWRGTGFEVVNVLREVSPTLSQLLRGSLTIFASGSRQGTEGFNSD